MTQTFILVHQTARQRALQAVQAAPDGMVVQIREQTRSLDQNAKLHALLGDVGDALGWKWGGQEVDLDDLKTIFVAAYRKATGTGARFAIGIDGQPVILSWRTRNLTKRECSDLIESIHAWAAELGIEITEPA